jgi:IMP cyclohydrolase
MPVFNLYPNQDKIDRGRARLEYSEYPGRVIIMGLSAAKCAIQAYALTGRSDKSRNRIFREIVEDKDVIGVQTVAPDMTEEEMAAVEGSDNIYYQAMDDIDGVYAVSNGAQTTHVVDYLTSQLVHLKSAFNLAAAVRAAPTIDGADRSKVDLSKYEDDDLATPRITGAFFNRETKSPFGLSIVRKALPKDKAVDPNSPIYTTVQGPNLRDLNEGVGFGLQTYSGDRADPKSFTENPYPFPLGESAEEIALDIWNVLNKDTKVSVVVRSVGLKMEAPDYAIVDNRGIRTIPHQPGLY